MKNFDLNHQYQLYLQRVGLKEDLMHPQQKTETKRAFMGACGQMLILLRDDLGVLPEDQGIEQMQSMLNQVGEYFLKETNKLS
jgi:hypothetical protein